jgi:hypothetical protein
MKICICIEADVNNNVFEELRELHKEDTIGTEDQYTQAIKIVEKIVGLPFYANPNVIEGKPCISSVSEFYDDTIILE